MTDDEESNPTLLGAAAEYYVMYQLLRQQMVAALAPAGVPDADIIVSDMRGTALAAVQVKARRERGSDGGWHMKAKHETNHRASLFYCFVDLGASKSELPRCWIVPSDIVATVLSETHQVWLKTPGRGGRAHNKTDMRRMLPDFTRRGIPKYGPDWLKPYQDKWDLIKKGPPQISN